jgi:hypothetical protein
MKYIQAKVGDLDYSRFKMAAVAAEVTLRELIIKALDEYIKHHNLLQEEEEGHERRERHPGN